MTFQKLRNQLAIKFTTPDGLFTDKGQADYQAQLNAKMSKTDFVLSNRESSGCPLTPEFVTEYMQITHFKTEHTKFVLSGKTEYLDTVQVFTLSSYKSGSPENILITVKNVDSDHEKILEKIFGCNAVTNLEIKFTDFQNDHFDDWRDCLPESVYLFETEDKNQVNAVVELKFDKIPLEQFEKFAVRLPKKQIRVTDDYEQMLSGFDFETISQRFAYSKKRDECTGMLRMQLTHSNPDEIESFVSILEFIDLTVGGAAKVSIYASMLPSVVSLPA